MASNEKVALVTGAGTGIGRSVALALMEAATPWCWPGGGGRRWRRRPTQGQAFGRPTLAVPTDIGDPASVKALFAQTKEKFGRLDLLFNNAGSGAPRDPAGGSDVEQWKAVVDVNLTGAFLCTQEAFRHDEGPEPARRPDHQQRLDLGPRAAAELRALHGDQARDHRADQVDRAGRPRSTTSPAARSTSATPPPR